ncbi:DeoR/GlpR family DNA-binding transcription regulator [Falsirhodobacter halotolerans]|uniref:DeoR/GlpR family DNA-binding transcription regulator n=1 Tax=Falsirhodobacter halotolerans TaxID=1146892 RepID=UPI001FD15A58|nr:DeoR/GlpR family DNA-binding transcription regulator [Falsirhodobacter halotolerans]MCJ8141151.1 DeoR/GlpR family DNA-binding transcription regulator [Falsirhodobacter halotolerans]
MLPAQRRARIIEILRRDRIVALPDLAAQVGASLSTTRRDVEYLCLTGHLTRTHGGAMINSSGERARETEPAISSQIERGAKDRIGQHAAALIEPGQTVLFDSGSTTAACARAAMKRGVPFTATTNDLMIAATLAPATQIECHMPAGRVRHGSDTLIGAACLRDLGRLHADIAFLGAHAVAIDGLSDTSIELAEIKRGIVAAADTVILLVDSSKIFTRAFCRFAHVTEIDRIVTDDRISPQALGDLRATGVDVDIVPL